MNAVRERFIQIVDCPDCGKGEAFRNRCSKCGGNSWLPAGYVRPFIEGVVARREREEQNDEHEIDRGAPTVAKTVAPAGVPNEMNFV